MLYFCSVIHVAWALNVAWKDTIFRFNACHMGILETAKRSAFKSSGSAAIFEKFVKLHSCSLSSPVPEIQRMNVLEVGCNRLFQTCTFKWLHRIQVKSPKLLPRSTCKGEASVNDFIQELQGQCRRRRKRENAYAPLGQRFEHVQFDSSMKSFQIRC